jgi:hypothetical protein
MEHATNAFARGSVARWSLWPHTCRPERCTCFCRALQRPPGASAGSRSSSAALDVSLRAELYGGAIVRGRSAAFHLCTCLPNNFGIRAVMWQQICHRHAAAAHYHPTKTTHYQTKSRGLPGLLDRLNVSDEQRPQAGRRRAHDMQLSGLAAKCLAQDSAGSLQIRRTL